MVIKDVHYSRYLSIKKTFCPNMTREVIEETPERWMDYYPHDSFLELLNKILRTIHDGDKPIWVVGNYGTGKTNTVLVIQKLLLDDEYRVNKWFDCYKEVITRRFPDIQEELKQSRDEKTFVVYDYNSSGVGPDRELIVRLEKSVVRELRNGGYTIPPASPLSKVLERVGQEGVAFERKLDELRDRFQFIDEAYTVKDIIKILENGTGNEAIHALGEVEEVLRARDIFLDVDVSGFRAWISKVCEVNGFGHIIYIFDEFSDFISNNTANLKTFEELAESPSQNKFMFIPVTHLGLGAFRADTSNSAEKSEDRYRAHSITMPDDIAFELMAHAINHDLPEDLRKEWLDLRANLWSSVRTVVDKIVRSDSIRLRQTFKDMLPIHPMTGFMLKNLSVLIGSNQRSVFDFLSDENDVGTFKKFIEEGGPTVPGKTFLTIDCLWSFFIESEKIEPSKDVSDIHSYYLKFRNSGQLRNKPDEDINIRVLKTILLFDLLSRSTRGGDSLLQPTKENIKLAYLGDPSMGSVDSILDTLRNMSCITVLSDGMITLYKSSVKDREVEVKAEELGRKFDKVNDITKKKIEDHIKTTLADYPKDRFDIKVTNPDDIRVPNQQFIDNYGNVGKDAGKICLWFVISKDHQESLNTLNRISNCLKEGAHKCRLVFFSFDNTTFCNTNKNEWIDYVTLLARIEMENQSPIRGSLEKNIESANNRWFDKIVKCQNITVYYWSEDGMKIEKITWNLFKTTLIDIDNHLLRYNIDHLVEAPGFAGTSKANKSAALSGMTLSPGNNNQLKKLIDQLKDGGYSAEFTWFDMHPDHALTVVRGIIIEKLESELKKHRNFSLDKVYEVLERAPYGFKPVSMTAIALGFCMKELADGRYQWTDGKMSGALDQENLALIIESTVNKKNDRNKKEICRLTDEDQAFIDYAPRMFGVQQKAGSIKDASEMITRKFEQISNKVPIWVIPNYVLSRDDPDAEVISSVIKDVSDAVSISAKGNVQQRSDAIRNVGIRLLQDPELPQKVVKYINRDTFQTAFRDYIKNGYPEMDAIANEIWDNNCYYTDSILAKMAETASYLWKETNLDENVNQVIEEYRIVKVIDQIAALSSFIQFDKAVNMLRSRIEGSAVPQTVVGRQFPQVLDVVSAVTQLEKDQTSEIIAEIRATIEKNAELIRSIFFDRSQRELLNIVKSDYQISDIPDEDLLGIIRNISDSNGPDEMLAMTEGDYNNLLMQGIDEYRVNSFKAKIERTWKDKTKTSSIEDWEQSNNMPARYALPDLPNDVFVAICNPDSRSEKNLESALESLESQDRSDVERSRQVFMKDMVPEQYRGLIEYTELISYLRKLNNDPSRWGPNVDLKPLIRELYGVKIAPKAKECIERMSSDELKKILIETIQRNEGLGIEIVKAIK